MKRKIFNGVDFALIVILFIIIALKKLIINGEECSVLAFAKNNDFFIFCFILVYSCALAFSFLLSFFAKKGHRDSRVQSILSVMLFITSIYEMIVISNSDGDVVEWNSFPVVPYLIILIAIVVLTFIKRSVTLSDLPKVEPTKNTEIINGLSNADEIKKYKQLLDDGVITQEEFDKKKKELL